MMFEEFALTNVVRKVSIRFSQYFIGVGVASYFKLETEIVLVLFCVCLLFSVNPLIGVCVRGGSYCLFQQSSIE